MHQHSKISAFSLKLAFNLIYFMLFSIINMLKKLTLKSSFFIMKYQILIIKLNYLKALDFELYQRVVIYYLEAVKNFLDIFLIYL